MAFNFNRDMIKTLGERHYIGYQYPPTGINTTNTYENGQFRNPGFVGMFRNQDQPTSTDFDIPDLKRPNQQSSNDFDMPDLKRSGLKIKLKKKKIKQTIFDKFNNDLSRKKLQVKLGSEDLDLLAELVLEEHEICFLNFNPEKFRKWFVFDEENNVIDVNKPLYLQNFLKPLIAFQSKIPHYSVLKGFAMKHLSTLFVETAEGEREIELTNPKIVIKKKDLNEVSVFIDKQKHKAILKVKRCLNVAHSNGQQFEFELQKILREVKGREAFIINKMQKTIENLETKIQKMDVYFMEKIMSHKKFVEEQKDYFEKTTKNILVLTEKKEQKIRRDLEEKIDSYEDKCKVLQRKILESNTQFQRLREEYDIVFERAKDELAKKIEEIEEKTNIETNIAKLDVLEKDFVRLKKNAKCEDNFACIICLKDDKEVAIFPCGHAQFCEKCVLQVMKGNSICPICREDIDQYKKIYYF